jgi:hypothetical protein
MLLQQAAQLGLGWRVFLGETQHVLDIKLGRYAVLETAEDGQNADRRGCPDLLGT